METNYAIDVASLDAEHHRALEDVIGIQLQTSQRLLIRVIDIELALRRPAQSLSDWTDVYEGLTDQEIETIDQEIKRWANLTRISS